MRCIKVIDDYLLRFKPWQDQTQYQFFINLTKTHKEMASLTVFVGLRKLNLYQISIPRS